MLLLMTDPSIPRTLARSSIAAMSARHQSVSDADYPQSFSGADMTWRTISNWLTCRRNGLPVNRPPSDFRARKCCAQCTWEHSPRIPMAPDSSAFHYFSYTDNGATVKL